MSPLSAIALFQFPLAQTDTDDHPPRSFVACLVDFADLGGHVGIAKYIQCGQPVATQRLIARVQAASWRIQQIMSTGRRGATGGTIYSLVYVIGGGPQAGLFIRHREREPWLSQPLDPFRIQWAGTTCLPRG